MFTFKCNYCNETYPAGSMIWRCRCGHYLDIEYDYHFDPKLIDTRHHGLWRYKAFLPLLNDDIVSFGECLTPLDKYQLEGQSFFLKHDYLFPSGSFKDRGNALMMSWLKAMNIDSVIEDSSGNAGASLAMYAARAGISARIFVPAATSASKLLQAEACGAEIVRVEGDRQSTADETLRQSATSFYASHVYNPLFYHGTKTLAYELYEQMQGSLAENIIIPVGNGSLLLGLLTGFEDLYKAGLIDAIPCLIAVQQQDYAPLFHEGGGSLHSNTAIMPTLAEGIAISKPLRLKQMKDMLTKYKGRVVIVSDRMIRDALCLAFSIGCYIEPTAAVAFAGFVKLRKEFRADEKVVVLLTGNGLKASATIGKLLPIT